jgi:hypothetical protein
VPGSVGPLPSESNRTPRCLYVCLGCLPAIQLRWLTATLACAKVVKIIVSPEHSNAAPHHVIWRSRHSRLGAAQPRRPRGLHTVQRRSRARWPVAGELTVDFSMPSLQGAASLHACLRTRLSPVLAGWRQGALLPALPPPPLLPLPPGPQRPAWRPGLLLLPQRAGGWGAFRLTLPGLLVGLLAVAAPHSRLPLLPVYVQGQWAGKGWGPWLLPPTWPSSVGGCGRAGEAAAAERQSVASSPLVQQQQLLLLAPLVGLVLPLPPALHAGVALLASAPLPPAAPPPSSSPSAAAASAAPAAWQT